MGEADWGVWMRDLHGPVFVVMCNRRGEPPLMTDLEKGRRLSEPVRVADEHRGLPINELRRLYPLPREPEGPA